MSSKKKKMETLPWEKTDDFVKRDDRVVTVRTLMWVRRRFGASTFPDHGLGDLNTKRDGRCWDRHLLEGGMEGADIAR